MLNRVDDWQLALDGFLQRSSRLKFSYGRADCCLWVCDGIKALTGADIAAGFRGTYTTRAQAMKAVREFAGKPSVAAVVEALTAIHTMPEVPILCAQRGDAVLLKRARDYSLGIVDLSGKIAVLRAEGITRIPLSEGLRAWRV